MEKSVPHLRRITLPVRICCLPLQPLVAAAPAPPREAALAAAGVAGLVIDANGAGIPGVQVESAGNPGAVPNIVIRRVGTTGSISNPL